MRPNFIISSVLSALLLAGAYFLFGIAGLQLAIPPGYASAIFPAAGIGFAVVLYGGYHLLPGVWLGSVGINLWIAWIHGSLGIKSLFVAVAIALGSTFQAWLSSVLVRYCLKNTWRILDHDKDIIRFLMLAGPLGCLISASWANSALMLFNVISSTEFAFNWWNWWIGDTIGVLLFAPLTLIILRRRSPLWKVRLTHVALPTLAAIAGIIVAFVYVSNNELLKLKQRIDDHGLSFANHLQMELLHHQEIVAALSNFIQVSSNLSFSDFERFTKQSLAAHPDLQALSWNPVIAQADRKQFEASMAQEVDVPGFRITQLDRQGQRVVADNRDDYVVVHYISPLDNNRQVLGYDIASDPIRHSAINTAIQSGKLTITPPVRLIQDLNPSTSVLLLNPVYKDIPKADQEAVATHLKPFGFTVAVFRMQEMLSQHFVNPLPDTLSFILEDKEAPENNKLLYRSGPAIQSHLANLAWAGDIPIGGRIWHLSVYPTPEYFAANRSLLPWLVEATGLILASLLQAFLLAMTGRNAAIQRQVNEQTKELASKEKFLRLSQEGGGIGTWEADLVNNNQTWSEYTVSLLGLPVPDKPTWEDFLAVVYPEDRALVIDAAQAHIDHGARYDVEYRAVDINGNLRWMRSAGQVEHNADGKPSIMRGIVQDITELHHNRQQIEQLINEQKAILESRMVGIVTARDRKIAWANSAFETMLGYNEGEVIGAPSRQFYAHEQDYQTIGAAYINIENENIVRTQLEFVRKDGRHIWVDLSGTVLHKDKGESLWFFIDVTERKFAETQIVKSLSLLYATLESTNDAILVVDLNNTWIMHNRRFVDLWNISDEILAANDDSAALSYVLDQLEDADSFLNKVHDLYATPEESSFDLVRFKNGKTIERYSIPQRVDGTVVGRVWSFHDITERKQAEYSLQRASEKNIALLRNASDGIHILDTDANIIEVSDSFCAMLGYRREEMIGMNVTQWDAKFSAAECIQAVNRQFEKQVRSQFETLHRRKDGTIIEVEVSGFSLELDGKPVLFNSSRDITERKKKEKEIRIAATVFESQEGMMVTDADNLILRVNQAFTHITGYSAEEVVGKSPRILQSGRQDKSFYAAMWESINNTGAWEGEIWNRRKHGEIYPEHLIITAVKDQNDIVTNYVATLTDITMSKTAADEIERLAFYDPLTGLPNRRLLLNRLKPALASSHRSARKGALLFIDMDNFKMLNDTLGHDMGDLLLQQVAERLTYCVREGDTVARLGGDEFVVMLEDLSIQMIEAAKQTEIIGNKILAVLNRPYLLAAHDYRSTPSIGAALFNGHQQATEELLKQADIAMYQAKASGRNTLRFFDPQMQASINARVILEADLRQALAENQFQLYYQPQVQHNSQVIGAEVLIRWQHPQRGLVLPHSFIPLAEETGLILLIGQWVLETACAQIKLWESSDHTQHLQLAVNVSAKQFHQTDFVDHVRHVLHQSAINPSRLKLELTESLVLDDIDSTIIKMQLLRKVGVHFSMDDFGTGQSSLSSLKKLPLDQLKIDQSFVRDISIDPDDAVIVQTIIAMANNLSMEVIAEGVETEAQRVFLEQQGCPLCQGYLFSKPIPLLEFEQVAKTF
ncbi:MAG: EAL domain-containing protein [Methylobacter sp.]